MFHSGCAKWSDIEDLYRLECQSPIRFAPKLKTVHIYPQPFTKMRVCLAAQTLSHSCASAILTYCHFNKMSHESVATAFFLQSVNDMFDMLNSRNILEKGFKKPFTNDSVFLHEKYALFISFVQSWRFF